MFAVAPVSVLLLGVIGMFIVAVSVARMAAEERRYRRPMSGARVVPQTAPRSPQPAHHA